MFSVAHIGETAHAVLQCETSGVVEARFERCAYINFSDMYICARVTRRMVELELRCIPFE